MLKIGVKMLRIGWCGLVGLVLGLHLSCDAATVESISPDEFEARMVASKGLWVVNISSTDPKCGYCAQANRKFLLLANSYDNAHFAQVVWSPWKNFPDSIRGLFERNKIDGIPARMVYQDGKLIGKLVGVPPDQPSESPLQVTGSIPVIDSREIMEKIRASKGLVVVQLTSFETSCAFCIRSNPVFESLAQDSKNSSVEFLRVAYRPWAQISVDNYAKSFAYSGLPIFATYKNGKLVRKSMGYSEQQELQKSLLDELL